MKKKRAVLVHINPMASWSKVIVCNGEGERTCRELLIQALSESLDLGEVGGITFVSDGEYITTEAQPRLKDLSEIPSPVLNGIFDDKNLAIALLETNRGRPDFGTINALADYPQR